MRTILILAISLSTLACAGSGRAAETGGSDSSAEQPKIAPVEQENPTSDPAPVSGAMCETAADCVPAQCCHPSACVAKKEAPTCDDVMCTEECRGDTMDCGQGSCGCVDGQCAVVWQDVEWNK